MRYTYMVIWGTCMGKAMLFYIEKRKLWDIVVCTAAYCFLHFFLTCEAGGNIFLRNVDKILAEDHADDMLFRDQHKLRSYLRGWTDGWWGRMLPRLVLCLIICPFSCFGPGNTPPSVSCARVIRQSCRRSSRFKLREHSELLSAVAGGEGAKWWDAGRVVSNTTTASHLNVANISSSHPPTPPLTHLCLSFSN
jgi:hypothetical protein